MFVKKLVEKATKKPGGNSDTLNPENVNPRLAFHYGIPSGAAKLANDPVQKIVAISTKNGQIKLLGKGNTQALLESNAVQPSKFLQFIYNEGILLNVTQNNQIEVWDIDKKVLCHVHDFHIEISSFTILQQCSFVFIGDSAGNVTVWKLSEENRLERMNYHIPFSVSHGNTNDTAGDTAVIYVSPQLMAESKRILLIFADGMIVLWGVHENKVVFSTGGATQLAPHETKKATTGCWVCPFGSKVAVGYNTGDISIFSIQSNSYNGTDSPTSKDSCSTHISPVLKLNLGYRVEKTPIGSLKWVYSDEKTSRLYVVGAGDDTSTKLVQVTLLNEETESRTVKLGLQLPEPCLDLEIVSCPTEQSKHKQVLLLLIGKSGQIYAYDDHSIEKHLLQSQSKSSPSIPKELMIKLPFAGSCIVSSQFVASHSSNKISEDQDYKSVMKNIPSLFSDEAKHCDLLRFTGFAKIRNLCITGHRDGTIKFWDVSCPLIVPLLSLTQQSQDNSSESSEAVTAVYYCAKLHRLFTGDKSGTVRIYQFKPEPFATENSFFSLPGSSKKGGNHIIHSVQCIKVKGSVLSFNINCDSRHLAVGSEKGHISIIDIEGPSILYQKQIVTELSADIISLQFESCDLHGFEKKILAVATRDSSLMTFEADTGNTLNSTTVQPKKRCRALYMQILDGRNLLSKGLDTSDGSEVTKSTEDAAGRQMSLLLCTENAAYVYSLPHMIQGIKKVWYKKKFTSCCWASIFCDNSTAGLLLLFACGKIQVRSLPELSVVKETTMRTFLHLPLKSNPFPDSCVCSSSDGEVIMMRDDQEVAVVSTLVHNDRYRHLESMSQVYEKNLVTSEDGLSPRSIHQKEKKKGLFGSVFKDVSSKKNLGADTGAADVKAGFVELSNVFSTSNFPAESETVDNPALEDDEDLLDIDDIDIDDVEGKPKGNNVMGLLNKQKLASKFQTFKGKLKQMTVKNEKPTLQDEPQSEKTGAVDQIKKKYGFSSSSETSTAKMVETKLAENVEKLQGINLKTTEMEDNARSFSSMAKETLRIVEQKNSSPKS